MRDSNRIDTFLKQIGDEWKKNPDLRFGQIISNTLNVGPLYVENEIIGFTCRQDPFYLEDREFLNLFKNYFNERRTN